MRGARLVTSADDGVLRFWNASDGRLLASLYLLEAGGDWLVVTPDGRVDGSEPALALTKGQRVPGLWRSVSVPLR